MGTENGIIFFASGVVILIAGIVLVGGKRITRRYLVYRIVPLAGFFGAFGLAELFDPAGSLISHAALAGAQTFAIMLLLHVFVGRHLRG
jgi:hypothetical protein